MSFRSGMMLAAWGAFGFQACGGGDAGFTGAGTGGVPHGGFVGAGLVAGGGAGDLAGAPGSAGGAAGEPDGVSGAASGGNAGSPTEGGAAGVPIEAQAGAPGGSSEAGTGALGGGSTGGLGGGSFGGLGGGSTGGLSGAAGAAGEAGGVADAGEAGMGGAPGPRCGNQVREGAEQCDDGNLSNLDACDADCKFEQSLRATWFKVLFVTDRFCSVNAFGAAFTGIARTLFQQAIDERVASGDFNLLFSLSKLDDLTGETDPSVSLGVLSGSPRTGVGYDGTSDLDWWYAPSASSITAARTPASSLAGAISGGVLNTTPGSIQLPLLGSAPLLLSNAALTLPIGASSKPLLSSGNAPGHLSGEQLAPTLVSFASAGKPNANGAGQLCGNISAASLQAQPIPLEYTTAGATPCNQGYSATSSYLDVLIGGCTIGILRVLTPTQPDQSDESVAQPGSGAPYELTASEAHVVNGCRDKQNTAVNLTACLNAAAYSSAFKFAAGRVIIK